MDPIEAIMGMSGLAAGQQQMPQQLVDQQSGVMQQAVGALLQALLGGQLPMSGPPGMMGPPPGIGQPPDMRGVMPLPQGPMGNPNQLLQPPSAMGGGMPPGPPPGMGGGMYPQ